MKTYKATKILHQQKGAAALLAVMILIFVFTAIAMSSASRNKIGLKMSGSATRYQTVYEAAELTLAKATKYLDNASTIISFRDTVSNIPFRPSNFDLTTMPSDMHLPTNRFVWDIGILNQRLTGSLLPTSARVDFMTLLDNQFWLDNAILSTPGTFQGIPGNNNIDNIVTYTFIERIADPNSPTGGVTGASSCPGMPSCPSYYLITVKASSYEPGTLPNGMTATNAKENVILQVVRSK